MGKWTTTLIALGFATLSSGAMGQPTPPSGSAPGAAPPPSSPAAPPSNPPAAVDPPAPEEPPAVEEDADSAKARARVQYQRGVELVRKAQWSEALQAFEESSALHPYATTTFNVGACERALGHYSRALLAFEQSLEQDRSNSVLPESTANDARAHVEEMSRLLVRVKVRVEPATAAISVDGRPLSEHKLGGRAAFVAGIAAAGPGKPVPGEVFDVVLDPGAHVFTLARKGFGDAVVNRTFSPGHAGELVIQLERLPATLKVTSSEDGALVRVADVDVGPAPVDVLRPAGTYRVVVGKEGFIDYETAVTVRPGEEVDLRAPLIVDEPSVLERWWFWAGAAVVIAGGVTVTYFATRPDPEPPPYEGGSTGWVVFPESF